MPGLTIRDRDGEGSLTIAFDGTEEFWTVELSGPGMTARRRVVAYRPHGGFDCTFQEMAAASRGWEGDKVWRSLEGELRLVCTRDGLGHIKIAVELRTDWKSDWRAERVLVVEAGQLDRLARDAVEFLDDGGLPAS